VGGTCSHHTKRPAINLPERADACAEAGACTGEAFVRTNPSSVVVGGVRTAAMADAAREAAAAISDGSAPMDALDDGPPDLLPDTDEDEALEPGPLERGPPDLVTDSHQAQADSVPLSLTVKTLLPAHPAIALRVASSVRASVWRCPVRSAVLRSTQWCSRAPLGSRLFWSWSILGVSHQVPHILLFLRGVCTVCTAVHGGALAAV
jgi:hypothetical protein